MAWADMKMNAMQTAYPHYDAQKVVDELNSEVESQN